MSGRRFYISEGVGIIEEGIQAFFRSVEGGESIKEGTDEVLVMSKARQENRISGREELNIFYTNARS